MTKDQAIIGTRVKSNVDFSGVPAGTEGVIDEQQGFGVDNAPSWAVAWDLENAKLPEGYKAYDPAVAHETHILRDWFSERELEYLDVVTTPAQEGGA